MRLNLPIMAGDGVGLEVTTEALNVLDAVRESFDQSFNLNEALVGGVATDAPGKGLSHKTSFMYDCRICQGRIGEMDIVGCAKAGLERLVACHSI